MRFKERLEEGMKQSEIDNILLKSATNDVFSSMKRAIDNYIGNLGSSLERKDVKKKKQFAFEIILKNLSSMKKDIK